MKNAIILFSFLMIVLFLFPGCKGCNKGSQGPGEICFRFNGNGFIPSSYVNPGNQISNFLPGSLFCESIVVNIRETPRSAGVPGNIVSFYDKNYLEENSYCIPNFQAHDGVPFVIELLITQDCTQWCRSDIHELVSGTQVSKTCFDSQNPGATTEGKTSWRQVELTNVGQARGRLIDINPIFMECQNCGCQL